MKEKKGRTDSKKIPNTYQYKTDTGKEKGRSRQVHQKNTLGRK